jgi:hypothetical protein
MAKQSAADRAKVVWKAFSVQALAVLGTQSVWYPIVEATAKAALGDHAQAVITAAVAFAGILGWIKPQASVSGKR